MICLYFNEYVIVTDNYIIVRLICMSIVQLMHENSTIKELKKFCHSPLYTPTHTHLPASPGYEEHRDSPCCPTLLFD